MVMMMMMIILIFLSVFFTEHILNQLVKMKHLNYCGNSGQIASLHVVPSQNAHAIICICQDHWDYILQLTIWDIHPTKSNLTHHMTMKTLICEYQINSAEPIVSSAMTFVYMIWMI